MRDVRRRPAVFLDRDGTILRPVQYLADPAQVELLPGVAEAVRRLQDAGCAVVVVTNQSAIGRGILTHVQYDAVHRRMLTLLEERGARLDGTYLSSAVPRSGDRTVVEHEDRKPGAGLLRQAATELGLELGASWMIGDFVSDVLSGWNAGCRGATLLTSQTSLPAVLADRPGYFHTAPDLPSAVAALTLTSEGPRMAKDTAA